MSEWLSSKEAAARIRAALKAKGWGTKQISVRHETFSLGSAVRVQIRTAEPPVHVVKEIAEQFERVARDGYGEILGGGNMYVSVNVTPGGADAKLAPYLDAALRAVAALPHPKGPEQNQHRTIVEHGGVDYTVSHSGRGWGFHVWGDGPMLRDCQDARNIAYNVAVAIEKQDAGLDQYGNPRTPPPEPADEVTGERPRTADEERAHERGMERWARGHDDLNGAPEGDGDR